MYKSIVILTGAGISAESGIKTFREADGLWENHPIEEVATYEGYAKNPKLVHEFYNARRRQLLSSEVRPNNAHQALADFEKKFAGDFVLITQNVDNLHERAESNNILHMHGELLKMRCEQSDKIFEIKQDLFLQTACECCNEPGHLRPHIVWFGEIPFHMDQIEEQLRDCDIFISIGTSGQVYPAAMFVDLALTKIKARTVEINLNNTQMSYRFDEHLLGPASQKVPEFLATL